MGKLADLYWQFSGVLDQGAISLAIFGTYFCISRYHKESSIGGC